MRAVAVRQVACCGVVSVEVERRSQELRVKEKGGIKRGSEVFA